MRMRTSKVRHEGGFTMIVTLGVLLVSSLLLAAAFTASGGDVHLTKTDDNGKKAYYAAQAGISEYAYHLNTDVNYWSYCLGGAAATNHALNQAGSTANKVSVPGASEEQYAIQLLPASSAPAADKQCDSNSPVSTMIESGVNAGGTFRIQSVGFSGNQERTIVATFAHTSFLNYIYYTKYETSDPATYSPVRSECAAFWSTRPSSCSSIQFVTGDRVNGPIHSEDRVSICGEPIFGRTSQDVVEFRGGSAAGGGSGCTNSANYVGTLIPPASVPSIEPPPSNSSLLSVVESAYHYTGKTIIVLTGNTMTVTNGGTKTENVPLPSNGVIYVSNGTCSVTYTPFGPSYKEDTGCGNVYVSGNYTGQLTIAAENDVVINGSITTPVDGSGVPTTNAVLGLIANNFVRVYHPLTGSRTASDCGTAANSPEALTNPTIYAAILAVNHSFIVDNYDCGEPLEKLSVYGAIAQIFRGTVGTHSGGSIATGYAKNYSYDDRLQVESPPYFLNPVRAAWHIRRETLAPNP